MKIKSQFHFLLAGIIIIPLILVISILSQHYANSSERLILPGYDELVRNLDKELHLDAKSWQFIQEKLSRRSADLEYLIFDNNKNLVLTNIQNFSNQDIFEFIYSTGKNYFYQIDTVYINEKDSFFVITRLPKVRRLSFDKFKNPFFIL